MASTASQKLTRSLANAELLVIVVNGMCLSGLPRISGW
jgi:hypothetical protein